MVEHPDWLKAHCWLFSKGKLGDEPKELGEEQIHLVASGIT